MTKRKEPDFMKDLHKIRAKLSKEWKHMSRQEFLKQMRESGKWLKEQLQEPVLK